jgi:recombinational DNA repair ATPase RecF
MTINRLLFDRHSFSPVVIFDDLFSELDNEVVNSVFKYFLQLKNQIFITSTSEPLKSSTGKQFQVVKGQLV